MSARRPSSTIEELEDADPAAIAARAVTCSRLRGRTCGAAVERQTERLDEIVGRLIRLTAIEAQTAGKPLGDHTGEGSAHDVVLDAHLDETRDRARRIARVQVERTKCPVSEAESASCAVS